MANSDIKINLKTALDAAGIEATKSQLNTMTKSVSDSMGKLATDNRHHWADIKAAWDMGCAAIQKAWQGVTAGIKSAFHFETMTTQFETLTGDIDSARAHMEDLKRLGDTPPFSLDEFARASRSLMVMTDGALGLKGSLEMVGNAAAATGNPLESVAHATGRLYATIRDGQPIGRAASELRNMGILTPQIVEQLNEMQKAGASSSEIWGVVTQRLKTYDGAMAKTELTGEGLMGAISSRWDNLIRNFGTAFMDSAKGGLQFLLDKLKDLEESEAVQKFADFVVSACSKAASAFSSVGGFISDLIGWFGHLKNELDVVNETLGEFFGVLLSGGSLKEARQAGAMAEVRARGEIWAKNNLKQLVDTNALDKEIEKEAQEETRRNMEEEANARSQDAMQEAEAERRAAAAEKKRKKDIEKLDKEWDKLQKEFLQTQAKELEKEQVADARANAQQKVNTINAKINQLNKEIANIQQRRANTAAGMGVDASRNQWGAYQYHFGSNGQLSFSEWQRANRYGPDTYDQQKANRRQEIEDKRMQEIEDRWRNGKYVSPGEMKKLGQWWDYIDERDGINKREKEKEKWEQERQKILKKLNIDVEEIKVNTRRLAQEGPLD